MGAANTFPINIDHTTKLAEWWSSHNSSDLLTSSVASYYTYHTYSIIGTRPEQKQANTQTTTLIRIIQQQYTLSNSNGIHYQ